MLEFILTYLLIGYIVTAVASNLLAMVNRSSFTAKDMLEATPVWPLVVVLMVFAGLAYAFRGLVHVIRMGLDD